MLLLNLRVGAAALLLASLVFADSQAEAQRVRVGFGGVRVSAPGVGVRVGPYGRVRVRAPGVAVGVPRWAPPAVVYGPRFYPPIPSGPFPTGSVRVSAPGFSYSSRVAGPSGAVQPSGAVARPALNQPTLAEANPAQPRLAQPTITQPTPVEAAKPALAVDYGLAGEAEMDAMPGDALLATLDQASVALNARLDEFANGEGWQSYFALGDAAAGDLAASEKLLRRFDSVTRDARFTVISNLSEFAAMHAALRVLVDRGGVVAPPAEPPNHAPGEVLPPPSANPVAEPPANSVDTSGERSVLKP